MQQVRIVSLLPSATEILFAIGAGSQVVGVSDECDYPEQARRLPVVSSATMPPGLTSHEIDTWVSQARHTDQDLYRLDADLLASLNPDLIITQDLCAVCAVDVATVEQAVAHLEVPPQIFTLDPHTFDDAFASIGTVGTLTGHHDAAEELLRSLRSRLAAAWRSTMGYPTARVALLEWTDPPFAPGHWIPEMVELAGASNALGEAGKPSVRTDWESVAASQPDVIVCAPCGYDLDGAAELAAQTPDLGLPVWAVDANASFARPGPRLVDGVEALAMIVHPHRDDDQSLARRVR